MNKQIFILFLGVLVFVMVVLGLKFVISRPQPVACTLEAKECPDGSFVSRVPPSCEFALCPGEKEGILISSPKTKEKIKSPVRIEGRARGNWFFEAQFTAEIYDLKENFLGRTIIVAKDNWMTEEFVPFEGELSFLPPTVSQGKIRFLSANPDGLPEHQKVFELPVEFEEIPYRKVLLYYYNPEKDRDKNGNLGCSREGLVAVEKQLPVSKTPIKDTIELLLRGKENLSPEILSQGVTTEFPLGGFGLKAVNLKSDGSLILEFSDPQNKTSGGACRANIIWFQIEATAKQFPEVKTVQFTPKELFQP